MIVVSKEDQAAKAAFQMFFAKKFGIQPANIMSLWLSNTTLIRLNSFSTSQHLAILPGDFSDIISATEELPFTECMAIWREEVVDAIREGTLTGFREIVTITALLAFEPPPYEKRPP